MVIGIIPPDQAHINADGTVIRSVGMVEGRGLAGLPAEERKKLEKEWERERKKTDGYNPAMANAGPFVVGGYGHWKQEGANLRDFWTWKEHKQFKNFLQLRRKWMAEVIPIEREALKNKLLKIYGTTEPATFEAKLNVELQLDDRLTIKTRRNVIRTTVELQKEYSASKMSSPETVKK